MKLDRNKLLRDYCVSLETEDALERIANGDTGVPAHLIKDLGRLGLVYLTARGRPALTWAAFNYLVS